MVLKAFCLSAKFEFSSLGNKNELHFYIFLKFLFCFLKDLVQVKKNYYLK